MPGLRICQEGEVRVASAFHWVAHSVLGFDQIPPTSQSAAMKVKGLAASLELLCQRT